MEKRAGWGTEYPAEWRNAGMGDRDPRVAIMALIAINRVGAISADTVLADAAFARESVLLQTELTNEDLLDTLRAVELTLVNAARLNWSYIWYAKTSAGYCP